MAVGGAPVTPVGKDGTVLGRPASYTPRGYRQFTSADLATAVGFADIAGGVPEGATTAIIDRDHPALGCSRALRGARAARI